MDFTTIIERIKALASRAKELVPAEVGAEIESLEGDAHAAVIQTQQAAKDALAQASQGSALAPATSLLASAEIAVEATVEDFVVKTLTPAFGAAAANAAKTYVQGGEAAIMAKLA